MLSAKAAHVTNASSLILRNGCVVDGLGEAPILADIILVGGDVEQNVTLLGLPGSVKEVVLNGALLSLPEMPERADPAGWRVAHDGAGILRRQGRREPHKGGL